MKHAFYLTMMLKLWGCYLPHYNSKAILPEIQLFRFIFFIPLNHYVHKHTFYLLFFDWFVMENMQNKRLNLNEIIYLSQTNFLCEISRQWKIEKNLWQIKWTL